MSHDLRSRLSRCLEHSGENSSDYDLNADTVLLSDRKLRPASVLVPIIAREPGASVVLTKRSSALKHHPGQISFPGGKMDSVDSDEVATALREAFEEIALDPVHADVVGSLPSHETVTGFSVTPVLAMIDPAFRAVPEPGEVEEVFEVPLDHVMNVGLYSIQSRRWRGQSRHYFTVPWGSYYIWGATARILRALAGRMSNDAN